MTLPDEPAWRCTIDAGRRASTDAVTGPRRVAIRGDAAPYSL